MAEVTTTKTYNLSLTAGEFFVLFQLMDLTQDSAQPDLIAIHKAMLNPDVPEADL